MKDHYYFAKAFIVYINNEGKQITEKKQASYELTQTSDQTDRDFFLGVELQMRFKLKKSFLQSRPYIKEDQIVSTTVE